MLVQFSGFKNFVLILMVSQLKILKRNVDVSLLNCDRLCINQPFTAKYRNPVFYIILLLNFC